MDDEIYTKLTELGRLTRLQEDTKVKIDSLKSWFERHATQELADTKEKTWEISDTLTSLSVGSSSTVKIISPELLKKIFGPLSKDLIEEKTTANLKDAVKSTLASMFLGEYIQQNPANVINQITSDPAEQKTLQKKLKGNYTKDKQVLISLLNISDDDAAYYAYMYAEAKVWSRWKQYTAESQLSENELLEKLSAAIIVDESIKTTIKSMK